MAVDRWVSYDWILKSCGLGMRIYASQENVVRGENHAVV